MAKFHDTGTICNAHKRACPLGLSDSDHIEASSVQEFEKKLGEKMAAKTTGTLNVAPPEEQVELYVHPQQGKRAYVRGDSVIFTKADGSKASSSATAAQLRAGRGRWRSQGYGESVEVPEEVMNAFGDTSGAKPSRSSAKAVPLKPSVSQAKALAADWREAVRQKERAARELQEFYRERLAYDNAHAFEEGRAYYSVYRSETGRFQKIYERPPVNSSYRVYFDETEEQKARREELVGAEIEAIRAEEAAQTRLELAGGGDLIPDEGHTIRVANQAQKWLLKDELQGQISDGKWENSGPSDHWQDWSGARVVVDPKNLGRNFSPVKDNYQLNAKDLLDVVGDRMVENVSERTGEPYSAKQMNADLRDLRKIFKTGRNNLSPGQD